MLLEFSVKNFRSIKDEQVFSMLPEKKIREYKENLLDLDGLKTLSVAMLYGRNASGKSNLLRAFEALQYLVTESAKFKIDSNIPCYEPYKIDRFYIDKPTEFKIDFIAKDKIRYTYEVSFVEKRIVLEKLTFYPKLHPANLLERHDGDEIIYGDYLTGRKKEIENLLYPNQLYLSKVGVNKIKQLEQAYLFFHEYSFSSTLHDTEYDDLLIRLFTNKMVKGNIPHFNANVNKLMKAADTGIQSIVIKERDIDINVFPEEMTSEEKQKIIEKYKYQIRTIHKLFDADKEIGETEFRLKEESTGTIKLLVVGGLILEALSNGQVLIIDELDKSLHPKLTRALINIFQNPKTNPNRAQLIFATHDISLLDSGLFRRDQVWFAEKEYQGYSHYYSIAEIPAVRKNGPFEKWYMSGKFGATPIINEFELNFEF